MEFRRFFALLTVTALPLACSDKSPTQPVSTQGNAASTEAASSVGRPATRSMPSRNVPTNGMTGTWGGDHVTITVGAASAILAYDCGHGTIDEPFVTDAKGTFNLVGTHVPESPGPVRPGEPVSHPALYKGTTDGKTMVFTATETDTGLLLGTFVLTHGVAGRLVNCL